MKKNFIPAAAQHGLFPAHRHRQRINQVQRLSCVHGTAQDGQRENIPGGNAQQLRRFGQKLLL